ncbi:MAG: MFS transporter [Candidatus Thorarchaeota archaeon]
MNSERDAGSTVGPYRVVVATGFGVFLSALDSSIVNVSLWTMATEFKVGMDAIQWVIIAYLLILTSLMPLAGKVGDRHGKTKVFKSGAGLFTFGSLACALSPTLELLVASRVFQAVGASMMTANGLALSTYFTTPETRGRAMGLNSIILAAALGLGPVLGGVLTQFFGWESIFLVNIPVGIIGFATVAWLIPETSPVHETRFDTVGALMFFVSLFSLVYAVSVATKTYVLVLGISAAVCVVSFVGLLVREKRFVSPIIPTRVLADRRISVSLASALLSFMAVIPVSFLMPFYLQEAMGFTQSITGIFLVIHPLVLSVTGPLAGLISERVNARLQTVVGLTIQLVGLMSLAFALPNLLFMAVSIAVMSFGLSIFTVANGNFVMTSAPRDYMGVVSALTNISRTTGFSVATALATSVFGLFFGTLYGGGSQQYFWAYTEAVQYTIWFFCVFALVACVISAFRGLSPAEEKREAAERPPIPLVPA